MRKLFFLSGILLGWCLWCLSAMAAWTNLGIYGGAVYSIAVDPLDPDKLFAGTYLGGGLFVSRNGGASWAAVQVVSQSMGEDEFKDQAVNAVAIAPSNPDVVWAAHNNWVAKSSDGGLTWTHIRNDTMQSVCTDCGGASDAWRHCMALAIHPHNPDVVYVGTSAPYFGSVGGAVYKTGDGGLTWQKLNQGVDLDYRVEDLAVDANNPDILWAVTNSNGDGGYHGSVYRSNDGGLSWTAIQEIATGFLGVALKADDSNTVFAACGWGVVQLNYDGTQWSAAYPLLDQYCYMASDVVFAPSDPNTVYACWRSPSAWGGDDLPKVSRGIHNGTVWSWDTRVVDTDHATSFYTLAVDPADARVLYGGDQGLGIVRSTDHGLSWTPVNQGLDAVLVYDVDVEAGNTSHMIAASGSGLYERPAGAEQWERRRNGNFRSVRFQPGSGSTYYGGSTDGYVLRTDDNGTTWVPSNYLDYARVQDIAVDPANVDAVYIATGLNGRQILRSLDGGLTFQAVLDGVNLSGQGYNMNAVAVDPSDSSHILAGGGNFYAPYVEGDLWESYQGGQAGTWQRTGLTNTIVNAVLIDPRDSNRIYAGCGYSQNYEEPLLKSIDGGSSWETATLGMPYARRGLYSLWASSEDNLFAVGTYGLVTRYDGIRWHDRQSPTYNALYGVFGLSARDVFAVGLYGTIIHYDGSNWSLMTSPTAVHLYKVWAAAADDVFAVGANGTILHYDGTEWTPMAGPTTEDLYEIRGVSRDHIFAAGTGGAIIHYDGSSWQRMDSGTSATIDGLWVFDSADVFAVGDDGVILHFDGSAWSAMQSGTTDDLWGIWGSGPSDVFAAGPQGDLLHYDGRQWTLIDLNADASYQEVWGFAPGRAVVADNLGGVWSYDGQSLCALRGQGTYDRSVTGLAFHPTNPDIIYAGTYKAGVYISPNQAGNWLNLGTPPSMVYAVSSGSLYAATGAGLYQLTGTGILAGHVRDSQSLELIHGATVTSDMGLSCTSLAGVYMLVSPTGIFDLFATDEDYQMSVARGLTVAGTEVTWHDFDMIRGSSVAPGDITEDITGLSAQESGDAGGGGYCFIGLVRE